MKIALFALLAVLLIGCQTHVHEWREATCTEPRTCIVCGETEGEAPGHEWCEATCTEPRTCIVCGETEGEALGHAWREATCTEPRTCARCGLTEGEPLGHEWTEATCTEGGVCLRCGETTPALGHDWTGATCLRPDRCARCGETAGEALGHEMVDGACTRCGFTEFAPITGEGDAVLEGIETGDGVYRVHVTHHGSGNCTVWAYDADGAAQLLVLLRGGYDGSVLLFGKSPYTFEIFTDGRWELLIEQLDLTADTSFAGTGDAVTDFCALSGGTFRFTYAGENDFIVWFYTGDGETLAVKALGACDETRTLTVPEDSFAFFAVRADAAWTIERIGE